MPADGLEIERLTELGVPFADLVRLVGYGDKAGVDPDRVVRLAAWTIPHTDHVAVTLVRAGRRAETLASTDDLPRRVDDLQYTVGQGPCLEASVADDIVLTGDLAKDTRWPAFADRCVSETGVRSMCSVRLTLSNRDRAAMNLYSTDTDAFDELDISVASLVAPFAALATEQVLRTEEAANLHTALTTSRQIGRAVGILMARELLTSEQAFALLQRSSQHLNRKLRDVAAEVERTGELPQPPRFRPRRGA